MTSPCNGVAVPTPPGHRAVIPEALVPERRGVIGCFSHVRRDGDWILPRLFRALAIAGNVEIDLTHVRLGAGLSHIEAHAIAGALTIIVPPDIRLECEGNSILGAFDLTRRAASSAPSDAPVVRITGSAFMGAVDVRIVDPNAPGWLDRLFSRRSG